MDDEDLIIGLDDTDVGVYDDSKPVKKKIRSKLVDDDYDDNRHCSKKYAERIILSLTKPSYVLGLGTRDIRTENRRRLERLLNKLVRRHNWKEASGVLSVLLKGTWKDRSLKRNRYKYKITMQILNHIRSDTTINNTKIREVFIIWGKKIGSSKNQPLEEKFRVQVQHVLFWLQQGDLSEAQQAAADLIREHGSGNDGTSNMIVGLTFFQLWYSSLPKELQLRDFEECESRSDEQDASQSRFNYVIENSNESYAIDRQYDDAPCVSDTSVGDNKIVIEDAISNSGDELSLNVSMERGRTQESSHQQAFYMNPADTEDEDASKNGDYVDHNSAFYAHAGLDPWLLPLQLPKLNNGVAEFNYLQGEIFDEHYETAMKFLQSAIDSTPPVMEALSPLIQMLMVGNRVKEALDLLEKFCDDADTVVPFRLRAKILERFDCNNLFLISSCYEEVLLIDPTCSYSLNKLVSMQQNGDYSSENLLKMIALHLDATYADSNVWKELALCFLKLSQEEEDRMSVCINGSKGELKQSYSVRYNSTPKIFTEIKAAESWGFRCKWWLRRHFNEKNLLSEISTKNWQLLTYKAACASHLYGHQLKYALKALCCLEKEDRGMFLFLQKHMQNSVGFYLNFARNTIDGKS